MGVVRKDSIINTVITYLGIGLGYINKGLLFPLLFSVEQVGLANLIILLAGFFAQFSSLGSEMVVMKFFPYFKKNTDGYSGFLRYNIQVLIIGFSLLSLVLFVGHDFFIQFYIEKSPLLVAYYYWIIPIGIVSSFYILFEHYLRAMSKNIVSVFIQVFVLRILVLCSLIGYYFGLYNFEFFIIIFFLLSFVPAVSLLIYLLYIKKFYISKRYSDIKLKFRKLMFTYGIYVYFNSLGRNLILMADTLMLASISGLETVGVYTVMVFLSNAVFVPYVSLIRISVPYVSVYWKEKKINELKKIYVKISSLGFFITFFIFSIVWFNFDYLLFFLPEEYLAGKYVFLFLMLGRISDSLGGINGDILLTSKKFKYEVFITVPLIFVTFYLNYLLIPIYNGEGAAIATFIVFLLYNIFRMTLNYYFFKLHPFTWKLFGVIFFAIVSFVINVYTPSFTNIVVNIAVHSIIPFVFFFLPSYFLNLIPEMNSFIKIILLKIQKK